MFKKFLFLGLWNANTGPSNVNRGLVLNRDKDMSIIKMHNKFYRIERLKLIFYPIIVVSGSIFNYELKLCKLLNKKLIYIMHGCVWYESNINRLNLPPSFLKNEARTLDIASLIVCVSEKYSNWVKIQYPQYYNKITFINNGLKLNIRPKVYKEPYSIALSGGNRIQKNNRIVCEAVKLLSKKGVKCKVYLFGRYYENNDDLSKYEFIHRMGHLDQEQYYDFLDKISLYVINSTIESFGLVVGDALNCNCSLLMSENVGASSIMKTEESDIIKNCNDIDEVANKILYLLNNNNSSRLLSSIDMEEVSEKKSYEKLKKIVNEI